VRGKSVKTAARAGRRKAIAVSAAERRRLIEICAYFRAAKFRPVEPGGYRAADLRQAADEIDAVIGPRPARRGRR
jgi:hypothetical protein